MRGVRGMRGDEGEGAGSGGVDVVVVCGGEWGRAWVVGVGGGGGARGGVREWLGWGLRSEGVKGCSVSEG